ncbi:STAS/SEC14 domain-containing protein [Marinomonas communis]|uniref:SpoIIAA-like protein n=1 Tax=Marinomonas communis TaxID=28254 RepID=A0A4R6X1T5_9GAMM|nr:STAS/SEC14 domain-containing protein [Marinomonas communis]TDR06378.1 SpoIIAA-like protein [Marinomonas communis]
MINQTSNISLNVQRHHNTLVLSMKPSGRPSSEDFQKLSAMIDRAVYAIHSQDVALLVDLSELTSVSTKSAWNELLHGLKIGPEFKRIAVYGHNRWHNVMISGLSWLISPNLKVFRHKQEATDWVMLT